MSSFLMQKINNFTTCLILIADFTFTGRLNCLYVSYNVVALQNLEGKNQKQPQGSLTRNETAIR